MEDVAAGREEAGACPWDSRAGAVMDNSRTWSVADRVLVVEGAFQGSGVLIAPSLVLTAAHVMGSYGPRPAGRVAHPAVTGRVECVELWRSGDIALLRTATPMLPIAPEGWLDRPRWGSVSTSRPIRGCQVVGFPDIQRRPPTGALELDQYEVTVLPLSGSPRQVLTCEFARPPATERADGTSPLEGLSGAPVIAGGVLIGIVTDVPRGRGHLRVEAQPLDRLEKNRLPRRPGEHGPPRFEDVTEVHPRDERFTEQYAEALGRRFRRTEIIGIDELGHKASRWDLNAAYLHLEAESSYRELSRPAGSARPRRLHELLATDKSVVLLRGEAGAGKTTLVWWLAAHAAAGTLAPHLARLNGLVPFVVPMRSVRADGAFPTPSGLAEVARLTVDAAPTGWARRVLDSGRGLLLIDGLDEVPQEDRDEARRWLTDLLEAFPEMRCLVTLRPLAVEGDWLGLDDGVLELRLLPMSDEHIQEFVRAWHDAARLEPSVSADERTVLTELEQELARQFETTPALRDLARTPLLCAVICALHRKRQGLLPTRRSDLYVAALDMLLGGRDKLRRIDAPEGIELDAGEHKLLLQRIAAWLVRNGQSQLSYEQARGQLAAALQGMPQIADQGPVEKILRHVLSRSGVLQERTQDSVQFIHRTFQDYLAAKELRDSDHLGELLRHADEEEWEDVVSLVIGHCTRGEVKRVVDGLVAQGDAATGPTRWRLHLLAATCATSALYLDKSTRTAVEERVAAILPPSDAVRSTELAKLGPYVLPLLPQAEGLGEHEQLLVLHTICRIGTAESLPLVRAYGQVPARAVRQYIAASWPDFPVGRYARDVLDHIRIDDLQFVIDRRELLHLLPRLGAVRYAELHMSAPVPDPLGPSDLDVVAELPDLRELRLKGLPGGRLPAANPAVARLSVDSDRFDVGDLGRWSGLRSLALWHPVPVPELLESLKSLPKLRALQLSIAAPGGWIWHTPTTMAGIRSLTLLTALETGDLAHVARTFPSLKRLTLLRPEQNVHRAVDLTALEKCPGLTVEVVYGRNRPDLVRQ
ncbi:hypothetical protein GCM10010381_01290 [Streptomyces xantholiticus]|nr:hypothetical protein GCM10010381_01290 [Streptomyces xantholiticus]